MKIESLEINLLKASEIKDGDIVIVKIKNAEKANLKQEDITNIYNKILDMTEKKIPIYFFPDNLNFNIIKDYVSKASEIIAKENIQTNENEENN
jgi:hypothetical protein